MLLQTLSKVLGFLMSLKVVAIRLLLKLKNQIILIRHSSSFILHFVSDHTVAIEPLQSLSSRSAPCGVKFLRLVDTGTSLPLLINALAILHSIHKVRRDLFKI
jgi:hypothetical protein